MNRFENALYIATERVAWGVVLAWVTFASMKGVGSIADL